MEPSYHPKRRKVPIGVEWKPRFRKKFYKISKKLHPKPTKVPFRVELLYHPKCPKTPIRVEWGGSLKIYIRKPACGGRLKPHCLRQCLVFKRKPACGGHLKPHCLRQSLISEGSPPPAGGSAPAVRALIKKCPGQWPGHLNFLTPPSAAARKPACLLYTSPSPRDRTRSRMPSSA